MWLLQRLHPDHKTIAEFRRCNSQALIHGCGAFVQFALAHQLIVGQTVAIDGSKLRAVSSRKALLGKTALQQQREHIAQQIRAYLAQLDCVGLEQRSAGTDRTHSSRASAVAQQSPTPRRAARTPEPEQP